MKTKLTVSCDRESLSACITEPIPAGSVVTIRRTNGEFVLSVAKPLPAKLKDIPGLLRASEVNHGKVRS